MKKNTKKREFIEKSQTSSNIKKLAKLIDKSPSRDSLRMFLAFFSKPSI